ncbi:hypothetical protein [Inquilinus limosus]|uniref:hypothetical protein n=1 Tax=Inquilinus limosus TaxID=171674 RepID=UPI000401D446|nr:hypothetical protein [Inquilinus limosus]
MLPFRTLAAAGFVLAGCIAAAPPEVPPDPAVATKVRQLSGNNACSDRIAGALTAAGITADRIIDYDLAPAATGGRRHSGTRRNQQRQAWLKMAGGGSVVVQFEPSTCRIALLFARDGAVLPAAG